MLIFHSEIKEFHNKIHVSSFRLMSQSHGALTSHAGDNLSPFKIHDFRLSAADNQSAGNSITYRWLDA